LKKNKQALCHWAGRFYFIMNVFKFIFLKVASQKGKQCGLMIALFVLL